MHIIDVHIQIYRYAHTDTYTYTYMYMCVSVRVVPPGPTKVYRLYMLPLVEWLVDEPLVCNTGVDTPPRNHIVAIKKCLPLY